MPQFDYYKIMNIFKKRVQIIQLGQNCIPRTILTRWKIKPSKLQGELTYPFDLAVFGIPEITKTLKTDFKEFFWNLSLHEEGNKSYWIKEPDCILFSHDKNLKTKEALIETYTRRIENFRKALLNPMPAIFVQILSVDEEINQQYKELLKLRHDRPFIFAVIDTQDVVKNICDDNIKILKLPYPNENYKNNWWKKEYYNSKAGKAFEKQIADFVREIIIKGM